jgi:hypothetical protein
VTAQSAESLYTAYVQSAGLFKQSDIPLHTACKYLLAARGYGHQKKQLS